MDTYMNVQISDQDLITQWLSTASFSQNASDKLKILHKLQELLVRKVPNLLPEFIDNVLSFATDKSADIKKALVTFIEEACKVNESLLTKVMGNLHMLLCVESIPVQKRVIQAAIAIYRKMLGWLCRASLITLEMEQAWNQLNIIKVEIAHMIDSDNDGVRTSAVKFLECVILLQTYPDQNENRSPNDFSLEDVPLMLKIARRRKLEEEANKIFDLLVKFNGSQHISSANLFACIGALTNIAKNRPEFMEKVVSAIELLHSNLPPTLGTTQVNSIRKKLKFELSTLIKHHAAFDYLENITTMMVELGYTQQEVQKMVPKIDERRRYTKRVMHDETPQQGSKKARIEADPEAELNEQQQKLATEANEKFVLDSLNIDTAVQLVLSTLIKLPNTITNQFKIDYAAFLKMGHVGEAKVLGKMLAIQLLEAGLGPGADLLKKPSTKEKSPEQEVITRKKDVEEEDKIMTTLAEYDYEAIIKGFEKQGIAVEQLEDKKNIFDKNFWLALGDNYEKKTKREDVIASNKGAYDAVFDGIEKGGNINRERLFIDRKIENIQQLYDKMEVKRIKESKLFFKNMEDLYSAFQELPQKFDDENMNNRLRNHLKFLNLFEQQNLNAKEEMESLKNSIKDVSFVDIPGANDVTRIIQSESAEQFENPMEIQRRLCEIRRNIEFLSKKIQDVKSKVNI